MALVIDIADALVTELNDGTFSQTFTSKRFYRPVFDLAEMKDLHVTVVPRSIEMEGATRSLVQHDYQIDIAVQKKVSDDAQIDGLMGLVQEIADFFRQRRLAAMPQASWVKTENLPVYAPEHLEQFRQFTSVLTITFRVLR